MSEEKALQKQLQVRFTDESVVEALYANAFFVVPSPGEFTITIGTVVPPIVSGTPAEIQQQLDAMTSVVPKRAVQLIFSEYRLKELHQAIGIALQETERTKQSGEIK